MAESGEGPRLRESATAAFSWVAAARIFERVLGVARIVVLARLLAPDEFGAFGIAVLAMATIERLSRPGLGIALVQRTGDVRPYLDSVWTMLLVRSWAIAGLVYATRGLVADFFDAPEAAPLMIWVAVATAVGGFTSIGLQLLQRDLDLHRRFVVLAAASVADIAVALPMAWITRDAVALAYGMVARNAVLVVASWLAHPYRPRPTLNWRPLRDLRDFAVHGAFHSGIFFFVEQGDDAFVGKFLGEASLGVYLLTYRMATILTQELAGALSEITVPVFSRLQGDPERLTTGVRETIGATSAVVVPAAVFLWVMAEPAIAALLGPHWLEGVPAFRVLLVFGVFRALSQNLEAGLTALAKVQFMTTMLLAQLAVAAAAVIPLGFRYGLPGVAVGVALSQAVSLSMAHGRLRSALECGRWGLLRATRGPIGASAVAGGLLVILKTVGMDRVDSVFVSLAVGGAVFAATYASLALPALRRDIPNVSELVASRLRRWTPSGGRRRS